MKRATSKQAEGYKTLERKINKIENRKTDKINEAKSCWKTQITKIRKSGYHY